MSDHCDGSTHEWKLPLRLYTEAEVHWRDERVASILRMLAGKWTKTADANVPESDPFLRGVCAGTGQCAADLLQAIVPKSEALGKGER